ncbi:MAG: DNA-binding transcriptional regulator [Pirellulales bacterium]|nr:DNA-binding transcriptional regulator [Pirellulales bacterium]
MQKRHNIAILVEWSRTYGRGVLNGLADYAQAHGQWQVFFSERSLNDDAPAWFDKWRGDGIIACAENPGLIEQIKRKQLPTVEVFSYDRVGGFAKVATDEPLVGRLAADHLLELGLRNFAFCGFHGVSVSEARGRYFAEYLAGLGHDVSIYRQSHGVNPSLFDSEEYSVLCEESVSSWIRGLPKPVGLFASNDFRAYQILMACAKRGISIPEEVALIGANNEEVICKLCRPPLTTIELDPYTIGYEAARLLDQWMHTGLAPSEVKFIAPKGLVVRQSTDTIQIADSEVAVAVRFIREHACDGIKVSDVMRQVSVSRTTLERRFSKAMGRAPKAEIDRIRLNRVKQLLTVTDYPLAKIAELCGFRYLERMCHLFRKKFGLTPGQYRKAK